MALVRNSFHLPQNVLVLLHRRPLSYVTQFKLYHFQCPPHLTHQIHRRPRQIIRIRRVHLRQRPLHRRLYQRQFVEKLF